MLKLLLAKVKAAVTKALSAVARTIPDSREKGRDPRWRAVERHWLQLHPGCAVCGSREHVQVHHKVPVSWDASRELDVTNLITLCPPHHLLFGHLGDWKSMNPGVEFDCHVWADKLLRRPYPPAKPETRS